MRYSDKHTRFEEIESIETRFNPKTALKIENISCLYDQKTIIEQVTLSLKQGQITSILGPSGCGKTTLLRAIAGLEPIHKGLISTQDRVFSKPGYTCPAEKRNIGFVFQNYALFPHMTVLENIEFALSVKSKKSRKKKARNWLELAGLSSYEKAYPHMLSGGEQQRLALIRCLAQNPNLILLDEPFSGLDGHLKETIRENTLETLQTHQTTTLMVTHDPIEALSISDKIALMAKGKILQTGSPDEVYLNPTSAMAARLTGEVNTWSGQVENGYLKTPFGQLEANPKLNTQKAIALIRPEAILLGKEANKSTEFSAIITEKKLLGARLELTVESTDKAFKTQYWHAHTPLIRAPKKGETVPVSLDPFFSHIVMEFSSDEK